jgi:pimeloyl-ACP methyl ester carboxylesterase
MTDQPPFVLLHGGRHGGWCWARVSPLLREAGHDVYTPTLTGLGERAHLLSPDIGLSTHIQDLVNVFEFEDIEDAVLVAHSYGGVVASGAMEVIHDRVRTLVFLDALLTRAGETVLDIVPADLAQAIPEVAARDGEGWYLPTSDASFYGVSDPVDAAWVNSKLTAQPLRAYTEPLETNERAWSHPGAYIELRPSQTTPENLARAQERAATDEGFAYRVLDAAHDAMVTEPERLTEFLLETVGLTDAHARA